MWLTWQSAIWLELKVKSRSQNVREQLLGNLMLVLILPLMYADCVCLRRLRSEPLPVNSALLRSKCQLAADFEWLTPQCPVLQTIAVMARLLTSPFEEQALEVHSTQAP